MKRHEIIKRVLSKLGGSGSGNFGHAGRPGKRGGSAPSGQGLYNAMTQYVISGPEFLSKEATQQINTFVGAQSTSATKLERVMRKDPEYETREIVQFDRPTSFTRGTYAEESMGAIRVKYSDAAMLVVDNPRVGYDVDYRKLGPVPFHAAPERETIVGAATRYRVVSVQEIDHPGKAVYGGFMVYHLEEL